ncbi:hypothetical protein B0A55_09994 [Friedmanniomyces simplex]|uniref:Uncharacterized protein n=1 Tax=Friedmanniomyces simplex TaxID=329884 RepID=A0A4U0WXY0_9PEZI|nr:hypothetical protein B0A55_09994 [Friedmanniomyces simplex]
MATSDAKPFLTTLPTELQLNIASHLLQHICTTIRNVVNEQTLVLAPPLGKRQYRRLRELSQQATEMKTESESEWGFPPTKDGEGGTDVLTKEGRVAMGLPVLKGKGGQGLRYALRQGGELERLRAAADGDVQG